ncbi:uncharacterized protein DS421_20g683980 [Arachis hypogaea]|nr:uncharacterized protein DS421_20g683980 [Arachis hypogaea]
MIDIEEKTFSLLYNIGLVNSRYLRGRRKRLPRCGCRNVASVRERRWRWLWLIPSQRRSESGGRHTPAAREWLHVWGAARPRERRTRTEGAAGWLPLRTLASAESVSDGGWCLFWSDTGELGGDRVRRR